MTHDAKTAALASAVDEAGPRPPVDAGSRAAKREVAMLRDALLGGPLGEPYGRDYAKLPEYAQEQIDGYVEAIQERHPTAPVEPSAPSERERALVRAGRDTRGWSAAPDELRVKHGVVRDREWIDEAIAAVNRTHPPAPVAEGLREWAIRLVDDWNTEPDDYTDIGIAMMRTLARVGPPPTDERAQADAANWRECSDVQLRAGHDDGQVERADIVFARGYAKGRAETRDTVIEECAKALEDAAARPKTAAESGYRMTRGEFLMDTGYINIIRPAVETLAARIRALKEHR